MHVCAHILSLLHTGKKFNRGKESAIFHLQHIEHIETMQANITVILLLGNTLT
jgi:hypothetical protein